MRKKRETPSVAKVSRWDAMWRRVSCNREFKHSQAKPESISSTSTGTHQFTSHSLVPSWICWLSHLPFPGATVKSDHSMI
jgi:hypothetical protein